MNLDSMCIEQAVVECSFGLAKQVGACLEKRWGRITWQLSALSGKVRRDWQYHHLAEIAAYYTHVASIMITNELGDGRAQLNYEQLSGAVEQSLRQIRQIGESTASKDGAAFATAFRNIVVQRHESYDGLHYWSVNDDLPGSLPPSGTVQLEFLTNLVASIRTTEDLRLLADVGDLLQLANPVLTRLLAESLGESDIWRSWNY